MRLDRLNDSLAVANRQLVQMGAEKDATASQARELQLAAQAQRTKADELLYISDMQQAGTALRVGDMPASRGTAGTSSSQFAARGVSRG